MTTTSRLSEQSDQLMSDAANQIMFPDSIMPEQFFARRQRAEPMHQLLLAVFMDAVLCIVDSRTKRETRIEALRWVDDELPYHPDRLTFLNLCEIFGFEPQSWRRFLHQEHKPGRQLRRSSWKIRTIEIGRKERITGDEIG